MNLSTMKIDTPT